MVDAYRRGREGPMDWELTQDSSASSSRIHPAQHDDTMDITFQDESIRDISMVDPTEDSHQTQAAQVDHLPAQTQPIEEIPRTQNDTWQHPSSSSSKPHHSSALVSLITSQSSRRRAGTTRKRRGSHSSIGSSAEGDHGDGTEREQEEEEQTTGAMGHWPLAPVVGTVINYLVPPISAPSATSASHLHHYTDQGRRSSSTAAQKAHTTLHPREKPLLLLSYAQLAFNASLLFLAGYILFALVWTIRLDVVERLKEIEDAYHHSITTCQRSHSLNCLIVPLPPALSAACDEWERCSRKKLTDFLGGSRLRVVIEVLSEAWEAGVGGLGWRTLAFSLLLLSVIVGGANSTLNGLRMGVLRKSRRGRGKGMATQENDDDEAEDEREQRQGRRQQQQQQREVDRRRAWEEERDQHDRRALGPSQTYSSSSPQSLPPPSSPYASFPPHHQHPSYAHQYYPSYSLGGPPLATLPFRAGMTGKRAGTTKKAMMMWGVSPSRSAGRARGPVTTTALDGGSTGEEWIDDE